MRTGISKDNPLARPHSIADTVENNARGEKAIGVGSDSVGIPLTGLEPPASEPIGKILALMMTGVAPPSKLYESAIANQNYFGDAL